MTGFLVVYMLAAPAFGAWGDERSRPRLIAAGVACWSIATALSGAVYSFWALLLARAAVGVGEAAYGTIAPGMLSDYFRRNQRGRVMAIFVCAIPVGSALGYMVGGLVDKHFGWRMAFFIAGAPGLLLALLVAFLPDPPRGATEVNVAPQVVPRTRPWDRIRNIISRKSYNLTVLGYAAYTFAIGALGFWMPSFLERVRGMPRAEATVSFGAIVAVTGFVGTFAGGWLGDYLTRYSRQAYLWLSGAVTLLAAPLTWIALTTSSNRLYAVTMVCAQLCLWLSAGPVNATIANLSSPLERATAFALCILVIHLLGDVISPPLIGLMSDASSLAQAIQIVPLAIVAAAALWFFAARAQAAEESTGAANLKRA
jgi:MFS family permease